MVASPGHYGVDSVAEITWGGFANPNGLASWDRNTKTCLNTYCHGNFAGGYGPNDPVWTASNQAHCGSCHDIGYDPATLLWKHKLHVGDYNRKCADCHAATEAFTDPDTDHTTSKGAVANRFGSRNAPTAMYARYIPPLDARALRLCTRLWGRHPGKRMLSRVTKYLSFLEYAYCPGGGFHNFLSYRRSWLDAEGSGDCMGQAVLDKLGAGDGFIPCLAFVV